MTVLEHRDHWIQWYEEIHTLADQHNHWDACDPELNSVEVRLAPERPRMPQPPEQDDEPSLARLTYYNMARAEFNDFTTAEREVCNAIRRTVHRDILAMLPANARSAHTMLKQLHTSFAPTKGYLVDQIARRYTSLLTETPPSAPPSAVRSWVAKWATLEKEAHATKSGIAECLKHDFLRLSRSVSRVWHEINRQSTAGLQTLADSLVDSVAADEHANQVAQPTLVVHGSAEKSSNRHSKDKNKENAARAHPNEDVDGKFERECVCGKKHRFAHCPYLIPATRPDGWLPDDDTAGKVLRARENPRLSRSLDGAIRWAKAHLATCDKVKAKYTRNSALIGDRSPSPTVQNPGDSKSKFILAIHPQAVRSDSVIVDSGSHFHICNNLDRFVPGTFDETVDTYISLADCAMRKASGVGTMVVRPDRPLHPAAKELLCEKAIYLPDAPFNIISVALARKRGINVDCFNAVISQGDQQICDIIVRNSDFMVEHSPSSQPSHVTSGSHLNSVRPAGMARTMQLPNRRLDDIQLWHQRLGHLHETALRNLPKAVEGINIQGDSLNPCEACLVSKSHQIIARGPQLRSSTTFEKIHLDFTILSQGIGGANCLLHLTDDASRMHFAYPVSKRAGALRNICEQFFSFVYTQWNRLIKIIRMDNDLSISQEYRMLLSRYGIKLELTAPYTPSQNGVAERAGGILVQTARTMLQASSLPAFLWPEAVKAAAYIVNHTRLTDTNRTAYEIVYNSKPHAGHLRAYGCRAYVLKKPPPPRTNKMEPRAMIGYLVGYDATNIFRVWTPGHGQGKVLRVRDVIFDESSFFDNTCKPDAIPQENIVVIPVPDAVKEQIPPILRAVSQEKEPVASKKTASSVLKPAKPLFSAQIDEIPEPEDDDPGVDPSLYDASDTQQSRMPGALGTEKDDDQQSEEGSAITVQYSSRHDDDDDQPTQQSERDTPEPPSMPPVIEEADDSQPPRTRIAPEVTTGNIVTGKRIRQPSARALLSVGPAPTPPKSFASAQNHPFAEAWNAAVAVEIEALRGLGTFDEQPACDPTAILGAIPTKWVFTYKHDKDGHITKFKARLVVRGDMEFNPADVATYAATPPASLLRFTVALAQLRGWHTVQFDICNAFVNASMENVAVHIKTPDGWPVENAPRALRLRRALYGLQRSPNLWYRMLTVAIKQAGFAEGPDSCLWINGKHKAILLHYVDDVRITGPDEKALRKFLLYFESCFTLRQQPGDFFLGIQISKHHDYTHMTQTAYIDELLARFNIDTHHAYTPMPDGADVRPACDAPRALIRRMREKVGSLQYLATMTRPDIAKSVNKLAMVMANPSQYHEALADRMLQYLYTTRQHGLRFSGKSVNIEVQGFSDASFADLPGSHSSAGYVFTMAGAAIDWRATIMRSVAFNTTESELFAASQAATKLMWWLQVLRETCDPHAMIPLHIDNKQTIRIITLPDHAFVSRIRHINVKRHWIRQHVLASHLPVLFVPTNRQTADIMTKSLSRNSHGSSMRLLGVCSAGSSCGGVSEKVTDGGDTATDAGSHDAPTTFPK
jgi:transposase InsO family protein